jgi:hypothetical protein
LLLLLLRERVCLFGSCCPSVCHCRFQLLERVIVRWVLGFTLVSWRSGDWGWCGDAEE